MADKCGPRTIWGFGHVNSSHSSRTTKTQGGLIAAAPDLLGALKEIAHHINSDSLEVIDTSEAQQAALFGRIRATIAKAEGRQ